MVQKNVYAQKTAEMVAEQRERRRKIKLREINRSKRREAKLSFALASITNIKGA